MGIDLVFDSYQSPSSDMRLSDDTHRPPVDRPRGRKGVGMQHSDILALGGQWHAAQAREAGRHVALATL